MRTDCLATTAWLKNMYTFWRWRQDPGYDKTSSRHDWVWPKLQAIIGSRDPVIWMWCVFTTHGNSDPRFLTTMEADASWGQRSGVFWEMLQSDCRVQTQYLQQIIAREGLQKLGILVPVDPRFDPLFKLCALNRYGLLSRDAPCSGGYPWLGSVPYLAGVYADIPEELTKWLNLQIETSCCSTCLPTK